MKVTKNLPEVQASGNTSALVPAVTVVSLSIIAILIPVVLLLGQQYSTMKKQYQAVKLENKIWEENYLSVSESVEKFKEEEKANQVAALKSIYMEHLQLLEKQGKNKRRNNSVVGFRAIKAEEAKSISAEFDSVFSSLPKSIQGEVLSAIGSLSRANEKLIDSAINVVAKDPKYGVRVDKDLVKAIHMGESRFNNNIVSDSGAVGSGQIMPKTGEAYGVRSRDLAKPWENTLVSVRFLADSYIRFNGNEKEVMASYEAGNYDRRGVDWKIKKHKGIDKIPYVQKFSTILLYVRVERKLREEIENKEDDFLVVGDSASDTMSAPGIIRANLNISPAAAEGQIATDDRFTRY